MALLVRPFLAIVGVFVAAVAIGGIWTRRSHWSHEKQWWMTLFLTSNALGMVVYSDYDWEFPEWARTGIYVLQGVLVVLTFTFIWKDFKA